MKNCFPHICSRKFQFHCLHYTITIQSCIVVSTHQVINIWENLWLLTTNSNANIFTRVSEGYESCKIHNNEDNDTIQTDPNMQLTKKLMIAFLGCRRTMNNMVSVGMGEWEVGGTYLMPDEGKRNTKRTKLIVVYRKTEHRGIRNRGKTINFMLMARHRRSRICNIEQLRKNSIKGTKKVNEMEISFLHNFGCHLPASPSSFKLFFPLRSSR